MADVLTILVVDDSAAMRAILGAILGAGGHEVMFAESVDVALELLKLRRPDVVLTDYTMPGMTGHDLVLRLRADSFDNPVFVVSSERDPEIRTAVIRAGADRWMPKPVCAATLLDALNAIVRGTAASRQTPRSAAPARIARLG